MTKTSPPILGIEPRPPGKETGILAIRLCGTSWLEIFFKDYILLHAIIVRNGFEEEQNLPRDNFSLSAIRLLSAEHSEARHVWSRKGKSFPICPRLQFSSLVTCLSSLGIFFSLCWRLFNHRFFDKIIFDYKVFQIYLVILSQVSTNMILLICFSQTVY